MGSIYHWVHHLQHHAIPTHEANLASVSKTIKAPSPPRLPRSAAREPNHFLKLTPHSKNNNSPDGYSAVFLFYSMYFFLFSLCRGFYLGCHVSNAYKYPFLQKELINFHIYLFIRKWNLKQSVRSFNTPYLSTVAEETLVLMTAQLTQTLMTHQAPLLATIWRIRSSRGGGAEDHTGDNRTT